MLMKFVLHAPKIHFSSTILLLPTATKMTAQHIWAKSCWQNRQFSKVRNAKRFWSSSNSTRCWFDSSEPVGDETLVGHNDEKEEKSDQGEINDIPSGLNGKEGTASEKMSTNDTISNESIEKPATVCAKPYSDVFR